MCIAFDTGEQGRVDTYVELGGFIIIRFAILFCFTLDASGGSSTDLSLSSINMWGEGVVEWRGVGAVGRREVLQWIIIGLSLLIAAYCWSGGILCNYGLFIKFPYVFWSCTYIISLIVLLTSLDCVL